MSDSSNASQERARRHFTGKQKVVIVKTHLVDGVAISDLCDKHQIMATQFDQWQKQLFENGEAVRERLAACVGRTMLPTVIS